MKRLSSLLAVSLLSALVSAPASAAVIYGDDLKFTYDDSTLYGSAFTLGNSIFFLPTSFRAESTNGSPATVNESETLNIEIEVTTEGYQITDFLLLEEGDYFLDGAGAEVTAGGQLKVTSLTSPCGILSCSATEVFDIGGLTTQGATTVWSGGTSVDLGAEAGWGADTNVVAQIQNNLSATTAISGENAWIQKKANFVGMEITVVPVPAAVWLFLSGLGALVGFGRRAQR